MAELMIVVVIIGVVSAFAIPSMQNIVKNQTISATSNEIISTLQVARTEAIKRSTNVRVCFKQNQTGNQCRNVTDYQAGRYVYVFLDLDNNQTFNNDDRQLYLSNEISHNIIYKHPSIAGLQITESILFNSRGNVVFDDSLGQAQSRGIIGICDDRKNSSVGRMIQINTTGRAQVSKIESDSDISCE